MLRFGATIPTNKAHQTSARHARTFQKPGSLRVMQRAHERQRKAEAGAAAAAAQQQQQQQQQQQPAGMEQSSSGFAPSGRDENKNLSFNGSVIPREDAASKPGFDMGSVAYGSVAYGSARGGRPATTTTSLMKRVRAALMPTTEQDALLEGAVASSASDNAGRTSPRDRFTPSSTTFSRGRRGSKRTHAAPRSDCRTDDRSCESPSKRCSARNGPRSGCGCCVR